MSYATRILFLSATSLLFACGSTADDDTAGPLAEAGVTKDGAVQDSATKDASAKDAANPSFDSGDVDAEIPIDAGGLTCTDPSMCDGGAPICCGTLLVGPGSIPNCSSLSVSSACTATCNTLIALACDTTDTARLCAKKSDCSNNNGNSECCTITYNGQTATACVNTTLAGFLTCQN